MTTTVVPPHDLGCEEALIGELLIGYRECRETVLRWFQPEWFYRPLHRSAFLAIAEMDANGETPDPLAVAAWLRGHGMPEDQVLDINWTQFRATSSWRAHARIVAEAAAKRRILGNLAEARKAVFDGDEQRVLDELEAAVADGRYRPNSPPGDVFDVSTLADLGSHVDTTWVIPGMLRRDHRAVIVAFEGWGKSVLLSQLAVLVARGWHPLWPEQLIPPCRTLLADFENPGHIVKERVQELVATAGGPAHVAGLRVWHRPAGVDLRLRRDRALFESILAAHQPDLVCLGPAYKTYRKQAKEQDEDAVRETHAVLDELRVRYGFALVMEHHAPFESQAGRRKARPFGTSLWLRWPEFGIGLEKPEERGAPAGSLALTRWRRDRVQADWPDRIDRGGTVPWTGYWAAGFAATSEELDF